jgi:hypothetical protein
MGTVIGSGRARLKSELPGTFLLGAEEEGALGGVTATQEVSKMIRMLARLTIVTVAGLMVAGALAGPVSAAGTDTTTIAMTNPVSLVAKPLSNGVVSRPSPLGPHFANVSFTPAAIWMSDTQQGTCSHQPGAPTTATLSFDVLSTFPLAQVQVEVGGYINGQLFWSPFLITPVVHGNHYTIPLGPIAQNDSLGNGIGFRVTVSDQLGQGAQIISGVQLHQCTA